MHELHCDNGPTAPGIAAAILWSMRAWVIGFNRRVAVEQRITRLWVALGAPEAADYILELMQGLSHGVTRTVAIHCVCNPDLSEDEALLISLVVGEPDESATHALLEMATPRAAGAACDAADGLRRTLLAAGHLLDTAGPPGWTCAVPASRTLH